MIKTKRTYDLPDKNDGVRILVDRLWPRGIKKELLKLDLWAKEISPSSELRKRFNHKPELWPEFKKLYREELKQESHRTYLLEMLEKYKGQEITLLYSGKDRSYNNAVVLLDFIIELQATSAE